MRPLVVPVLPDEVAPLPVAAPARRSGEVEPKSRLRLSRRSDCGSRRGGGRGCRVVTPVVPPLVPPVIPVVRRLSRL